jgi:hypothetical protein
MLPKFEKEKTYKSTLLFLSLELINYARVARVRVVRVVTEVVAKQGAKCSGKVPGTLSRTAKKKDTSYLFQSHAVLLSFVCSALLCFFLELINYSSPKSFFKDFLLF